MAYRLDFASVRIQHPLRRKKERDSQRLVVFALVKTGLAGFDSYGPLMFLERAIVTMWPNPVPPAILLSALAPDEITYHRESQPTFRCQQIVPSILAVDVRSFRCLDNVRMGQRWFGSLKTYQATSSVPYDIPVADFTGVQICLG